MKRMPVKLGKRLNPCSRHFYQSIPRMRLPSLGSLFFSRKPIFAKNRRSISKRPWRFRPNDPLVLANVAETYENLGDRARALDYASASLKSGFMMSDLQGRPGLEQVLSDKSFHASGKK